jgi:aromatic-L-amino-acid decarboxylase
MQDVVSTGLPHYMELGPELTRPNRGIQVWMALNLHGVRRFRDELDRMLDLAEYAAQRLRSIEGIQLIDSPQLSVVAFRAAAGNEMTSAIFDALITSRRVHVSSTTIDGDGYVRFAFLSQRTTVDIVDQAIDIVAATVPG